MSGAIGGSASVSKDNLPRMEKEDEEKHKQREKTAYVPSPKLSCMTKESNLGF
jgi:hypothetical protein